MKNRAARKDFRRVWRKGSPDNWESYLSFEIEHLRALSFSARDDYATISRWFCLWGYTTGCKVVGKETGFNGSVHCELGNLFSFRRKNSNFSSFCAREKTERMRERQCGVYRELVSLCSPVILPSILKLWVESPESKECTPILPSTLPSNSYKGKIRKSLIWHLLIIVICPNHLGDFIFLCCLSPLVHHSVLLSVIGFYNTCVWCNNHSHSLAH